MYDDDLSDLAAGIPIVAIGASAGGLQAFEAFFDAVPPRSGLAFVLIAHLAPAQASLLPELLQRHTAMPVHQVTDGMVVLADSVYVIPPGKLLTIASGRLGLEPAPQERPAFAIDIFFRALAKDRGPLSIGVVLSGTGTDGTLGGRAIKDAGGLLLVQDLDSASYDGMPQSANSGSLADAVLPPSELVHWILAHCPETKVDPGQSEALLRVVAVLRAETTHDFSLYKRTTLIRRIERRMSLLDCERLSDYATILEQSPAEVVRLFSDILIGVTSFFRDPEAFEALRKALGGLLEPRRSLRVWVAGCATGEEAYSLAIVLHEAMQEVGWFVDLRVYATDIDPEAIKRARTGRYPSSIKADVTPERLAQFFSQEENGDYRVRSSIRECLVFAVQSITSDPPFTKLDLISCRNVLIYMGRELQAKLIPLFYYSLQPGGYLLLGTSETTGQSQDLFEPVDRKWKLYQRTREHTTTQGLLHSGLIPTRPTFAAAPTALSAHELARSVLQQGDTPPSLVINASGEIAYVHGKTGRYLELAEGPAGLRAVDMARPGLGLELAGALAEVFRTGSSTVREGLRVHQPDGLAVQVDLSVRKIATTSAAVAHAVVSFREPARAPAKPQVDAPLNAREAELEQALATTRRRLGGSIEALQVSNEELRSANEELQSTNEELQTSKEEFQSLNEESLTVNAELGARVEELTTVSDDMKNLLDSTGVATIFLDLMLQVRRFTPGVTHLIPLSLADIGRPISHFASDLEDVDLATVARATLDDLTVQEVPFKNSAGRSYCLRVRPYRTIENVIDGVVVTFEDQTRLAETILRLEKEASARKRMELAFQQARRDQLSPLEQDAFVYVIDAEGRLSFVTDNCLQALGWRAAEAIGQPWVNLLVTEDRESAAASFQAVLDPSTQRDDAPVRFATRAGPVIVRVQSLLALLDEDGSATGALGVAIAAGPVTEINV